MCHYICVQYSHSAWFLDGRTSILVIASMLKYTNFNVKFKCVCITMCPLVMNPFSHDLIKTQFDYVIVVFIVRILLQLTITYMFKVLTQHLAYRW